MRRPIFQDAAHRTAVLVNAIESDRPVIDATDVDAELKSLAAMCLSKDSEKRRSVLTWASFKQPQATPTVNTIRDRLRQLQVSLSGPVPTATDEAVDELVLDVLVDSIRQEAIKHSDRLPPVIFSAVDRSTALMTFSAAYGPSSSHLLSGKLLVRYKVDLVDVMMKVLEINACATLISGGEVSSDCFSPYISVFQGAYIKKLCTPRVLVLYTAVMNAGGDYANTRQKVPCNRLQLRGYAHV